MNWKTWLKGLAAAVVAASATGTTQVMSTSGTVNKSTAIVAGMGGLVGALGYLLQSPLPSSAPPPTVPVEPATKPSV